MREKKKGSSSEFQENTLGWMELSKQGTLLSVVVGGRGIKSDRYVLIDRTARGLVVRMRWCMKQIRAKSGFCYTYFTSLSISLSLFLTLSLSLSLSLYLFIFLFASPIFSHSVYMNTSV